MVTIKVNDVIPVRKYSILHSITGGFELAEQNIGLTKVGSTGSLIIGNSKQRKNILLSRNLGILK